jgi:hypothetical protein
MKHGTTLRIWLVLAMLFPCALAKADGKSYVDGIDALVVQSKQSSQACFQFKMALSKLDTAAPGSAAYRTREASLGVLKKLGQYPGTPQATSAVFSKVIAGMPSDVDYTRFIRSWNSMQGTCDPYLVSTAMDRLINSTRTLKFSQAERTQIRAVVMSILKTGASTPNTLIVSMLELSNLKSLTSANLVKTTKKSLQDLNSVASEADKIRAQISERIKAKKTQTDKEHVENLIFEIDSANRLRQKMIPLIAEF